jgi:beta-glucosidase
VYLEPGETKTVEFVLNERDFSFFNPYLGKWITEPGKFNFLIGSSSRDIRQQKSIDLF